MSCKLIIGAGHKGGVGRSMTLRMIATWMQEAAIEPYLICADEESRTMSRFFPSAQKMEARSPKTFETIINLAASGKHPIIIVDPKGGSGNAALSCFEYVPHEELIERGVAITCVGVITPSSPDSVSSLLRWVFGLGTSVRWLVVKNCRDFPEEDPKNLSFPEYDLTKQAIEFRKRYKPAEIILPALDPEIQGELERVSMTIRDVLALREGVPDELKAFMTRAKLRNYQRRLFEQLDTVKHLLL